MWETQVRSLGREDLLVKGMAAKYITLLMNFILLRFEKSLNLKHRQILMWGSQKHMWDSFNTVFLTAKGNN